jgi:hypothetical protein
MSRAVLVLLILYAAPALAQTQNPPVDDVAIFVRTRSAEILKVEEKKPKPKCPEPVDGEEIVVCAEVGEIVNERVFERTPEASGASANANAAACIPGTGCRIPLSGGTPFGKRRPPAIPLEEVYKGLPEPDMVVVEGSTHEDGTPK